MPHQFIFAVFGSQRQESVWKPASGLTRLENARGRPTHGQFSVYRRSIDFSSLDSSEDSEVLVARRRTIAKYKPRYCSVSTHRLDTLNFYVLPLPYLCRFLIPTICSRKQNALPPAPTPTQVTNNVPKEHNKCIRTHAISNMSPPISAGKSQYMTIEYQRKEVRIRRL